MDIRVTKPIELVRMLIEELVKVQLPGALPEKVDGEILIPGTVSIGDGRVLHLTRSMERTIGKLGIELKASQPQLGMTYTDKEWAGHVRRFCGPALAKIDLQNDFDSLSREVLAEIEKQLSTIPNKTLVEYNFGCTMFGKEEMSSIQFGPIRFESRNNWLTRKVSQQNVSMMTASRIKKRWIGEKVRPRRGSVDAISEKDILEAIGECTYVCSVTTAGLGSEAGRKKAQVAARLAQMCIALWWATPSKAVEGMNLLIDGLPRVEVTLTGTVGHLMFADSLLKKFYDLPFISTKDWEGLKEERRELLLVYEEMFEFWLNHVTPARRPNLMATLFQAVLWFHEGCRAELDVISVVKFVASLDALASGKKVKGIKNVIKARLGAGSDTKITSEGRKVEEVVKNLYEMGRNKTIHGTNGLLGKDWSSERSVSESLARVCILACMGWAATHSHDDPELLMSS